MAGTGRDPFSWVTFMIFFHAMLYIFLLIGSFGSFSSMGQTVNAWGISNVASFLIGDFWTGIITTGIASAVVAVGSILTGKIQYGIVFGIIASLYVNTWVRLSGVIDQALSSVGEYSVILGLFGIIIGTAFTYLVINAILQTLSPTAYGR